MKKFIFLAVMLSAGIVLAEAEFGTANFNVAGGLNSSGSNVMSFTVNGNEAEMSGNQCETSPPAGGVSQATTLTTTNNVPPIVNADANTWERSDLVSSTTQTDLSGWVPNQNQFNPDGTVTPASNPVTDGDTPVGPNTIPLPPRTVTPEPSTMIVVGLGLAFGALPITRRFRRK